MPITIKRTELVLAGRSKDQVSEALEAAIEKKELPGRRLAPQHSAADFSSRQTYADVKTVFVMSVTERALAEGYPRAF